MLIRKEDSNMNLRSSAFINYFDPESEGRNFSVKFGNRKDAISFMEKMTEFCSVQFQVETIKDNYNGHDYEEILIKGNIKDESLGYTLYSLLSGKDHGKEGFTKLNMS